MVSGMAGAIARRGLLLACAFAAVALVTPQPEARSATTVPADAAQLQLSFAPLVRKVAPAVVNVYVTRRVKTFVSPFGDDPFFRQFFGDDLGVPRERMENSLGSGVIVTGDGLVVTNNHVIAGSGDAEIRVALFDKREVAAKVILRDEKADLAVLRIDANGKELPHLEFADSDRVEVGDLVLAIGNPFGVGQTVTSGIVSALARTSISRSDTQYFIQTDAAVNPGNSGGALIGMDGRLIGVNTAIVSRSGGSIGIGFAIPANLVKLFVDSAITGKAVKQPWTGAKLQSVTREIAQALRLERVEGAVVVDVYPGSPAGRAGLKAQDVIVAVESFPVEDARALTYRLETLGIGGTARLRFIREGKEQEVKLALEEAPGLTGAPEQLQLSGAHPFDGARVAGITPEMAQTLGMGDLTGVVIIEVAGGSIAQGFGFRPGDVILRVNRTRVRDLGDLDRALRNPQRMWRLEIARGGRPYILTVPG